MVRAKQKPEVEEVEVEDLGSGEETESDGEDTTERMAGDPAAIALYEACLRDDLKLARSILSKGKVKLNERMGQAKRTPLHVACSSGSPAMCVLLIEHGGDYNTVDEFEFDCMMVATQHGHHKVVALLFALGASLSSHDIKGFTPLLWGCYHQTRQELCEARGDKRKIPPTDAVRTILMLAPQSIHYQLREEEGGHSALHLAVMGKASGTLLRALMRAGADAECPNAEGMTALRLTWKAHSWRMTFVLEQEWIQSAPHKSRIFNAFFMLPFIVLPAVCALFAYARWYYFLMLPIGLAIIVSCTPAVADGQSFLEALGYGDYQNPHTVTAWTALSYGINVASVYWLFVWYVTIYFWLLHPVHNVAFLVAFGTLVWSLRLTTSTDTSVSSSSATQEERLKRIVELAREAKLEGEQGGLDICPTTLLPLPARGKYCVEQGAVVARFDHYCPFVNNAVGRKNHHYFICFLVSAISALLLFILGSWSYIARVVPAADAGGVPIGIWVHIRLLFKFHPASVLAIVLALVHVVWIGFLLALQLHQTAVDVTTYEKWTGIRQPSPFDMTSRLRILLAPLFVGGAVLSGDHE
jgi:palmitoyltransferase